MPIQLTPTKIKGSKYLLIPKDLAQLLEIDDKSILNLTIEDTEKGQRHDYSIREKSDNTVEYKTHKAQRRAQIRLNEDFFLFLGIVIFLGIILIRTYLDDDC